MTVDLRKTTCFVVMPFGQKPDNITGEQIDFDGIYRFFILKATHDIELNFIRCDEIAEAGSIHEKMFEHQAY